MLCICYLIYSSPHFVGYYDPHFRDEETEAPQNKSVTKGKSLEPQSQDSN